MNAPATSRPRLLRDRSFWVAFLLGAATMAGVDEIVFHQVLQWHHFYDQATGDVGLVSDGLLHAAELLALGAGFFLMLDARRRGEVSPAFVTSGFLVGLGVFQLWDGVIHHKVLQVHQVRYGVDLVPYDLAWSGAGVLLLLAGIVVGERSVYVGTSRRSAAARAGGSGTR